MLGSERSLLIRNPVKRALVRLIGDMHFGRVLRFMYLKRALTQLHASPASILDAGCGKGYIPLYLAKRFPRADVVGLDVNETDVAEANLLKAAGKLRNVTFKLHDLQQSLGYSEFDLVISLEVMQYVTDEAAALRNLCTALSSRGIFLLHVMHSVGGYRRVGIRRMRRVAIPTACSGSARSGYTEQELDLKLKQAGFAGVKFLPTFGSVGMFAHSVFETVREWPGPLFVAIYPLLLLLGYFDLTLPKTSNGAILAIAWKNA
jgi:SAM-dependent methyltransferase